MAHAERDEVRPEFWSSLPPGAVDVVQLVSHLPDRASIWVGTYCNRLTAAPTAWVTLGVDTDKLHLCRWPEVPATPDSPALRDAISHIRNMVQPAWLIELARYLSPAGVLEAGPDSITLLCHAGDPNSACWAASMLVQSAEQTGCALPPIRLAVAQAGKRRTLEIVSDIAKYCGVVAPRAFPMPEKDPCIGANASFTEAQPPALRSVIEWIRGTPPGGGP